MIKHPLSGYWSQFDLILCINLAERIDRKRDSEKLFQKMGIPVQYHTVERHPKSGEIGCFESHQACMRAAYQAGCNNVLIFEDDPDELNPPTEHTMSEIIRFIKTNQEWDLLFLGAYPSILFETSQTIANYTSIFKMSSQLTHAVCVSRKMMQKMLRLTHGFFNAAIDAVYLANKNSFCLFPTMFAQTNSPSDISKAIRGTPEIRRAFVQFKNTYAQYSPVPFYYVVLALFVMLVLLLLFSCFTRRNQHAT